MFSPLLYQYIYVLLTIDCTVLLNYSMIHHNPLSYGHRGLGLRVCLMHYDPLLLYFILFYFIFFCGWGLGGSNPKLTIYYWVSLSNPSLILFLKTLTRYPIFLVGLASQGKNLPLFPTHFYNSLRGTSFVSSVT